MLRKPRGTAGEGVCGTDTSPPRMRETRIGAATPADSRSLPTPLGIRVILVRANCSGSQKILTTTKPHSFLAVSMSLMWPECNAPMGGNQADDLADVFGEFRAFPTSFNAVDRRTYILYICARRRENQLDSCAYCFANGGTGPSVRPNASLQTKLPSHCGPAPMPMVGIFRLELTFPARSSG